MANASDREVWPDIPLEAWKDTCATLHLWTQIVGKVRLTQGPWINHCWNSALCVTAAGIGTPILPHGARAFEIEFDFLAHRLAIRSSDGRDGGFALEPIPVATFYRRLMEEMAGLGLPVRIHGRPNEIADAIPFARDEVHRAYDADRANRYWRALLQVDRVFKRFRSGFIGKCSPVNYFWGAPDLALTRFSGRTAPEHPGGIPNMPDRITREAYSHEVSSCGFWPGGGAIDYPAFYAYAYPEPAGFAGATVGPAEAFYSTDLGEFILPYDAVRLSPAPDDTLLEFLQTTYEAAADLAKWDRRALER